MTHLVSADGGFRVEQKWWGEPYRPHRGEGQLQVCFTFLVLSTVLLKRDLKHQGERTRRLRPTNPGGPDPDLSVCPSTTLTSLVSECGEGLRMGCMSLPC